MNPWEIVSWVGAVCVAVVIVVATGVVVRNMVKSKPAEQKPRRIV